MLYRNLLVAYRDPTIYYLQLFLHSFYGFMVGAVFFNLSASFDRINDVFAGVAWITFLQCYMQVFKVHYLDQTNKRFHHEFANRCYGVFPYWAAELASTALCSLIFVPGVIIAYFMMGFPSAGFGPVVIDVYLLAITSEGMIHLITQFSRNSAYAVVAGQSLLIILCVFAAGSLIPEDRVPGWWVWLQELSLFSHASRTILHSVEEHLSYYCPTNWISGTNCVMQTQAFTFPCSASYSASPLSCSVDGMDLVRIFRGVTTTDKWLSFLYLFLLHLGFRLGVLFMYYFPFHRVWLSKLKDLTESTLQTLVFEESVVSRRLQRQVGMLQLHINRMDSSYKAAIIIQRTWRSFKLRRDFRAVAMEVLKRMRGRQSLDVVLAPPSCLVWKNLTLTVGAKKVLIDHVDGYAMGGRVLALMGPSGAGKTTLLNALSGRSSYAKVTGGVWLNGRRMLPEDINFVPQFDDLNGVQLHLLFHIMCLLFLFSFWPWIFVLHA